jgi:hypothetical protein
MSLALFPLIKVLTNEQVSVEFRVVLHNEKLRDLHRKVNSTVTSMDRIKSWIGDTRNSHKI